jgi:hypothetical protein
MNSPATKSQRGFYRSPSSGNIQGKINGPTPIKRSIPVFVAKEHLFYDFLVLIP